MSKTDEKRRLYPRLKRLKRPVLILLAISLFVLVSLDRYRYYEVKCNVERIDVASKYIESEVLLSKTPLEWRTARIKGTNGWEYIEKYIKAVERTIDWNNEEHVSIHDHGPPDYVKLAAVYDEINIWYWPQEGEDFPLDFDEYSDSKWSGGESDVEVRLTANEQYAVWILETNETASAFARAASCDCVAVLPEDSENYPDENGKRLIGQTQVVNVLIARVLILANQGKQVQAETELLSLYNVFSRYSHPVGMIDLLYGYMCMNQTLNAAILMQKNGLISESTVRIILDSRVDWIARLESAYLAEIVWMYQAVNRFDWKGEMPDFFDWVFKYSPRNSILGNEVRGGIKGRYILPIEESTELAHSLESYGEAWRFLNSESRWDESTLEMTTIGPQTYYPAQIFGQLYMASEANLTRLELELRLLQSSGSKLAANSDKVAEIARKYEYVVYDSDGKTIRLAVDPTWRFKIQVANSNIQSPDFDGYAREPQISEPDWDVTITPFDN